MAAALLHHQRLFYQQPHNWDEYSICEAFLKIAPYFGLYFRAGFKPKYGQNKPANSKSIESVKPF